MGEVENLHSEVFLENSPGYACISVPIAARLYIMELYECNLKFLGVGNV